MSDVESPDAQSEGQDTTVLKSAAPADASAGQPKKQLFTVSRVILFGILCVAIFMFIQDRRASSAWSDAHEWLKEQELNSIENGTSAALADVWKHMEDNYGLYPEDHPNLPTEYYRWSTWVREFTIEIQINPNDQVLIRHSREIRYNWMENGQDVIEEDLEGDNAPPPEGTPASTAGGGPDGPPQG